MNSDFWSGRALASFGQLWPERARRTEVRLCATQGKSAPKFASVSPTPVGAFVWSGGVCLLLLSMGCADFSRGRSLGGSGGSGSMVGGSDAGSGSSYAIDIHSLLLDRCGPCHSPTGAASDTQLVFTGSLADDYESTFALVDVSRPAASRLVVKMEGRGHAGGAIYTSTSAEHAQVLRWIGEGAVP